MVRSGQNFVWVKDQVRGNGYYIIGADGSGLTSAIKFSFHNPMFVSQSQVCFTIKLK